MSWIKRFAQSRRLMRSWNINELLDTCLKECLLTNQTLHKIVTKLMATCLLFANEMKSFYDGIDITQKQWYRG